MSSGTHTPTSYQGISRKYRPQTFANVVGQEPIVTTLKNALRLKKIAQAYLFCGTRGTGKTTLARVLAKALNCQNLTHDFEPCNTCTSCLEVMQGRSLNVFEIDGASNRGIDDIRQLNETVGYAPASGNYKIYIIDEVHMLTKEAFNALLKTLEEPPPNVKFFFATTEPHKVLPTILSRCQRFDLQRITPQKILQKLKQIASDIPVEYEEEALQMLSNLADGSLRVAESLLDQILCFSEGPIRSAHVTSSLGVLPLNSFFAWDKSFAEGNIQYAFTFTEQVFSSGKDFSYFLECLLEHYRHLLLTKLHQRTDEIPLGLQKSYQDSAALYTEEQCLYILDYLVYWFQQASKTAFKRITIEMILLHILRSKQRVPIERLVKRLQEMESSLSSSDSSPLSPSAPSDHFEKSEMKSAPSHHPTLPSPDSSIPTPLTPPVPAKNPEKKDVVISEEKRNEPIKPLPQEIPLPSIDSTPPSPMKTISTPKEEKMQEELSFEKPSSSPSPSSKKEETEEMKTTSQDPSILQQAKYETLMRFASVELEGTLTKEST